MAGEPDCVIVRIVIDGASSEAVNATKAFIEPKLAIFGAYECINDVSYEKFGEGRRLEYLLTPKSAILAAYVALIECIAPRDVWDVRNGVVQNACWNRREDTVLDLAPIRWISIEPWYTIENQDGL